MPMIMWVVLWRPLGLLIGALGAVAVVVARISLNPVASSAVTGFVIAMMVVQGIVSLSALAYGAWTPLRRRVLGER